jgi:Ser/Thr protein kinase RdoA (MazF antagonist)
MLSDILSSYGLRENECSIRVFGTGLINHTWKITAAGKDFILQRINDKVFEHPFFIAENIARLGAYLSLHSPGYLFVQSIPTLDNESLVFSQEHGYFRLSPFVAGSRTYDVAETSDLAFEAASQFGKFTRLLADFPASCLHSTLPDFHNLSLRQHHFEDALQHGNRSRISQAEELIRQIGSFHPIVAEFGIIRNNPDFRLRVTHHDTKISNVLFDDNGKGLCVIDLDTVMPGYFISDLGDMLRTYLSPVSEEEKDFSRICIREDYFEAIVGGYLAEMGSELTAAESSHIVYAGKFMIYMQAIRFLTDHLNDDIYYGAKYEGHNLVRASNQVTLLQRLAEKEPVLTRMIYRHPGSLV